jgi:hypothetical protein
MVGNLGRQVEQLAGGERRIDVKTWHRDPYKSKLHRF